MCDYLTPKAPPAAAVPPPEVSPPDVKPGGSGVNPDSIKAVGTPVAAKSEPATPTRISEPEPRRSARGSKPTARVMALRDHDRRAGQVS